MCLFIIQRKKKRKEKEKLLVFKRPITQIRVKSVINQFNHHTEGCTVYLLALNTSTSF